MRFLIVKSDGAYLTNTVSDRDKIDSKIFEIDFENQVVSSVDDVATEELPLKW